MNCSIIITDTPEITAHPLNETKTEGDNVTFTCDAIGNPVPLISWFRDGSPIDTSDNSSRIIFSVDKKQLAITNVSRSDSGEYRCVAENSVGNETSNVATLDVQCKYMCGVSVISTVVVPF